jgi:uncharacterized protein YuzE
VAFAGLNWHNTLDMSDHSGIHDRFAFYDRESDIAWLPTGPPGDITGEKTDWGIVARDVKTGAVVSIEIWSASKRLPKEILDALPEPVGPDPSR